MHTLCELSARNRAEDIALKTGTFADPGDVWSIRRTSPTFTTSPAHAPPATTNAPVLELHQLGPGAFAFLRGLEVTMGITRLDVICDADGCTRELQLGAQEPLGNAPPGSGLYELLPQGWSVVSVGPSGVPPSEDDERGIVCSDHLEAYFVEARERLQRKGLGRAGLKLTLHAGLADA